MKTPFLRSMVRAALCGAVLGAGLLGCASNEPYSAPQQQPSRSLPRAPVVAPSEPASPWWFPAPDSWWPFG